MPTSCARRASWSTTPPVRSWRNAADNSRLRAGPFLGGWYRAVQLSDGLWCALSAAPDGKPKRAGAAECQISTELLTDPDGTHVERLSVRTLAGVSLVVRATQVILAMGGLEIPRLLLASRRTCSGGLGNDYDQVGRNYMCHIAGTVGALSLDVPRRTYGTATRSPMMARIAGAALR